MIDVLIYIGIGYSAIAAVVFLSVFFFGGTAHVVERFVGGLIIALFFPWFAYLWLKGRKVKNEKDF